MPIICHVVFDCGICKKELKQPVYGTSDTVIDDELRQLATDYLRLAHWNQNHLTCALCGDHIAMPDMDLAYNDGSIKIHGNYTDNYEKVQLGERQLLHVHPQCIESAGVV